MEHITHGVTRILDNNEICLKRRTGVEALETEKAQLAAQVAAITQEPTQKSKDIRKYQVEETVVLSRVRELMDHSGEVVNKAHIYDHLIETADPSSAQQTL